MPRTRLDLLIPFQPAALLAYVSLWVYVGVGPGLQLVFPWAARSVSADE